MGFYLEKLPEGLYNVWPNWIESAICCCCFYRMKSFQYIFSAYCFQKNKLGVKTDTADIYFPFYQDLFSPSFLISYTEI